MPKKYILQSTEDEEQKSLIAWWGFACHRYGLEEADLLHIPNERKGGASVQAHFAAMGVRAGCPDLLLTVPVGNAPGLFIEMKSKFGVLSKNQKPFCARLAERGYTVQVCKSWQAAQDVIRNYLAPILEEAEG